MITVQINQLILFFYLGKLILLRSSCGWRKTDDLWQRLFLSVLNVPLRLMKYLQLDDEKCIFSLFLHYEMSLLYCFGINWPEDLWGWIVFLYFLLLWVKASCLYNAYPRRHSSLTLVWMDVSCFAKQFLTFVHLFHLVSSPLYFYLQPYLSVMLNKASLEVLMFTGSHSPRRVVRRLDQGVLNDGREHSLRIERLPGRLCACLLLQQSHTTVLSDPGMVFLSLSGLLLFRWMRRPRGRLHFPTISP